MSTISAPLQKGGESHPYYHHGLKKNFKGKISWGKKKYLLITNSLGLKDSRRRKIPPVCSDCRKRIVIIGDSFTEGVGLQFEKTFAGMLADTLKSVDIELLNAGARSYSPLLYYLRIKFLIEEIGLRFDHLVVCVDISDVQDELVYDGFSPSVHKKRLNLNPDSFLRGRFFIYETLRHNFVNGERLKRLFYALFKRNRLKEFEETIACKKKEVSDYYLRRGQWTQDSLHYVQWGARGISLARENMKNLLELCRKNRIDMTIAVYPWPEQVSLGEVNSMQVTVWEEFSRQNSIDFVDLFPFFIESAGLRNDVAAEKYYIKGDCHFNENGSRLVADGLIQYFHGRYSSGR